MGQKAMEAYERSSRPQLRWFWYTLENIIFSGNITLSMSFHNCAKLVSSHAFRMPVTTICTLK